MKSKLRNGKSNNWILLFSTLNEVCFSPSCITCNHDKLVENYKINRNYTKWNLINLRKWKKYWTLIEIAEFKTLYYIQPHPPMALAVLTECVISISIRGNDPLVKALFSDAGKWLIIYWSCVDDVWLFKDRRSFLSCCKNAKHNTLNITLHN